MSEIDRNVGHSDWGDQPRWDRSVGSTLDMPQRRFEFSTPGRDRRRLDILRAIRRAPSDSQHQIARDLFTSVGMVHRHIHEMMDEGLVRAIGSSSRSKRYQVTNEGKQELDRLSSAHRRYMLLDSATLLDGIVKELRDWEAGGGRGAVVIGANLAGSLLAVALDAVPMHCYAVVDPDPEMHGTRMLGLVVQSPQALRDGPRYPDAALLGLGLSESAQADAVTLAEACGLDPLFF